MTKRITMLVAAMAVASSGCDQPTEVAGVGAGPPTVSKGAVHTIPDPECAAIDGLGNLVYPVDCRQQVATFSTNGNATAVVQASGVDNPTGHAVHWDAYNPGQGLIDAFGMEPPLPCTIPDTNHEPYVLWTLNWKATLSAGGQFTMTCHYSKKWEYQWPG